MINAEKLSFIYENEEVMNGVNDISLHIPAGQCVVLCGPSGCGKTTLLKLISGLVPLHYSGKMSGNLYVDGREPVTLSSEEKAHLIGMVFQDPRSQFFMSNVRDEWTFSGENLGYQRNIMQQKVADQSTRLGLTDLLASDLNNLSSGQKQKIAIASSCFLSPKLLLLDEPSANLDEDGAQVLVDILQEIKRTGTTIIISEHRLHSFLPVADRFVCLQDGQIVNDWAKERFSSLSCEELSGYSLRHPDMTKQFFRLSSQVATGQPLYKIRNLEFRYRKSGKVFSDISFDLKPGSITAILGGNGSGKTTLCKVICGLLSASSGSIYKNDKQLSNGKRRKDSYFVMQDPDYQLFTESVGNELVLGQRITEEVKKRAYEGMELFNLTKLKSRHPASLSGGEKQRVTLAAAWCSNADLIVLDEPTSGLDAHHARLVAKYMCQLASKGKVVLVITHDPLLIALAGSSCINLKKSD